VGVEGEVGERMAMKEKKRESAGGEW